MKDNLEEFITEHRDELDVYEPPKQMWQGIDKKMQPKKQNGYKAHYAIAASLLLIAGAMIWMMKAQTQKTNAPETVTAAINPEIKDAEVYYASIVETKSNELSRYGKEYPDMFKDFEEEMDSLHMLYGQLKTEYVKSNGNEAVTQALVENLQKQVELLSTQLQIIQELQQHKGKKGTHSKTM